MNMARAIAHSTGNKASAISESGGTIIVQERYSGVGRSWLHIWRLDWQGDVWETDLPVERLDELNALYGVNPQGDCWLSV